MPLRLKTVLVEYGISQPKLATAMIQANGTPMSSAAISMLINSGYWPRSTPINDLKQQAETFLRAQGIPKALIRCLWDEEAPTTNQDVEPVEVEMLSPNAKRHFKLFRDPFQDEVNGPDDVFLSSEQRYIAEAMYQTAKNGGFLAVAGESGSGKSTLRKMLLERIKGQQIRVIFPRSIDKTRLSTGNICQSIINDLAPGTTVRSSLEAQARQVEQLLIQSARADNSHVLVIEEAHDLTIQTLKYLKRFYELEDGFRRLLSIVLVGQQELKDKLDEGRHPEAREVIRRCEMVELLPLDGDLEKYLAHKLKRVGIESAAVFSPDAYDAIRVRLTGTRQGTRERVSQLYPLAVNNTVTKAMNRAAELGMPLLCADLFKEV